MFNILKRKKPTEVAQEVSNLNEEPVAVVSQETKKGLFSRLKSGLTKTRTQLFGPLTQLFRHPKPIDPQLLQDIETHLLMSDVGLTTTQFILEQLKSVIRSKKIENSEQLFTELKNILLTIVQHSEKTFELKSSADSPVNVILMVGVNGAGKTTTIGKISRLLQQQDYKIMLAAGDTFRAAAIDQLKVWGERHHIPVVAQQAGSDSASVIYDAIQSANAKNINVVIADTAGRLHTQLPLMDELKKIQRVIQKCDPVAPHEVLLVLDASIGQNALVQAEQFHKIIPVTGLVITKLDGTAKGGVVFALADQMKLPIYFIGVGESAEDLRYFNAQEFIDALFSEFTGHVEEE